VLRAKFSTATAFGRKPDDIPAFNREMIKLSAEKGKARSAA
jgi:hypothetical protein